MALNQNRTRRVKSKAVLIIEPENRVHAPEVDLALVVDHQLDDHVVEVLRRLQALHLLGEFEHLLLVEVEPLAEVDVVWEELPEVEDVLERGS